MSKNIPTMSLTGMLSSSGSLRGTISSPLVAKSYNGDYKITPKAFQSQRLKTSNRFLLDDIVISEVPYYENENHANGLTAYIAKEGVIENA